MVPTLLAPGAEIARRSRQPAFALLPLAAAATLVWAPPAAAEPPAYESVVVAPAPPPEQPREDSTASASVITVDRTPRAAEDVPQLLSEQPGVAITRYGSAGSLATISLRGSAPNQVSVYVDGVPLSSALTGSVDAGLLPLTGADRIEIYRGQSPLAFGSSAIGGVVSITSEPPAGSGADVHAGAGSFGTRFAGGAVNYAGPVLTLVGRLSLFDSAADFPYTDDRGTVFETGDDRQLRRQNNHLLQRDALVRAGVALPGRRRLVAVVSALDRQQGLPARGNTDSWQASLRHRRLIFSSTYEDQGEAGSGRKLRATAYMLLAEQRLQDLLHEIGFQPTDSRDRSSTFGATALAEQRLDLGLRLSAMLDARHEAFDPLDRRGVDLRAPGRRSFGAAGASASYRLGRVPLELSATGRLEGAIDQISDVPPVVLRTAPPPRTARELLPLGRLGALFEPHPTVRLRANAGRYARFPSLFERYGNNGVIIGNPALVPERGWNADLGATFHRDAGPHRLTVDGALFGARSEDLIEFEVSPYFARFINVGRARTLGAELSVTGRAFRHLQLFAQGTFTDVRDGTGFSGRDGNVLPYLPRLRAYARPEVRDLPLGRHARAGLYADVDVTGRRYEDPANLTAYPTRTVFGAGGYVALPDAGLRLLLSAYNLTAATVNDVLEFPLPGRSVFLTLDLSYPNLDKEIAR